MPHTADRLAALTQQVLGRPSPIRIRAWDGSEAGPPDGPTLVVRNRRALRRLMWKPGELGFARGWVSGDLDVDGDLYDALDRLAGIALHRDEPPPVSAPAAKTVAARPQCPERPLPSVRTALGALRPMGEALTLTGLPVPPPAPAEEVRRRRGMLHSLRRDQEAIRHHYDVGNDFYALILGPSMVYSCAYWDRPDATLEDAQRAKLDLVCRKLALGPGMRLLDVGCGWGSMALHAAEHYGVQVVGITISREQADLARKRVSEAGLTGRVEIRIQDYREHADGPYDAISSIGMAEHVGRIRFREYADSLHELLRPGGRLLNHQIARRPARDEAHYHVDEFIDRYVFPDGELTPVGSTVSVLEEAGFEVRDVHALREHYATTLRAWVANLEAARDRATRLTSPGRVRVWRLYMAASALAFEQNRIGVNQILAVKTPASGRSGMPPTRTM
ncbi:cyclopropane-fatty-acyl-phospholipid synthase family protein [Embleya sp. NBC_00888]|uniref:class I SAM-dependent methyltransferase n=1 Tax=Embleya sp. NBC_00888 TaxID=2975960 RepID=UPI00386FB910|nr:cyclopropane-fatty-acyl-phospholipid synthase family protein [Embleya sp. NBC_00888]